MSCKKKKSTGIHRDKGNKNEYNTIIIKKVNKIKYNKIQYSNTNIENTQWKEFCT